MTGRRVRPRLTPQEQQVFELLGDYLTPGQIADRLGLPLAEAREIVHRVLLLRGTPNLEAIEESVQRLKAIKFV